MKLSARVTNPQWRSFDYSVSLSGLTVKEVAEEVIQCHAPERQLCEEVFRFACGLALRFFCGLVSSHVHFHLLVEKGIYGPADENILTQNVPSSIIFETFSLNNYSQMLKITNPYV